MLIVYLLIFLTVLWGLKLRKEPSLDAAVSVRQGTMLKGVFVLLVFASHVGGYLSVSPADPATCTSKWQCSWHIRFLQP